MTETDNYEKSWVEEWALVAIDKPYKGEFFTFLEKIPVDSKNGTEMYTIEDLKKGFERTRFAPLIEIFKMVADTRMKKYGSFFPSSQVSQSNSGKLLF